MGLQPLVSNASTITRLHCERSCAKLLRVCTSVRHHSMMSSIRFLFGLPLRFCPSMIPSITFFTDRLSSILKMCPNNSSFLSMSICITYLSMSNLCLTFQIRYFLLPVYVEDSFVTFHFKGHQRLYVSLPQHPGLACVCTLITHDLIMLSFVRVLMCMLFHIFLNPPIAPVALPILL